MSFVAINHKHFLIELQVSHKSSRCLSRSGIVYTRSTRILAKDAVASIYQFMVSSYREGTFRPYLKPDIGGLPGIEFRTRYFSQGKTSAIPDVPITPNVDPHGILGDYVKGRPPVYSQQCCWI